MKIQSIGTTNQILTVDDPPIVFDAPYDTESYYISAFTPNENTGWIKVYNGMYPIYYEFLNRFFLTYSIIRHLEIKAGLLLFVANIRVGVVRNAKH